MRDLYIDKHLIEELEKYAVAPKYDVSGDAEHFMREWAKYEGKLEIIMKLKKLQG